MTQFIDTIRNKLRKVILTKRDRRLATFPLNSQQRLFYHAYLSNREFPLEFRKTKSIFIHTPKCAGTSIIESFYNNAQIGHYPAIWYEGAYPQEFENYFKFSFVRNPYDRIVSAYHYIQQHRSKRNEPISKFASNFKNFEHFVLDWLSEENVKKIVVTTPQYLYLEDQFGSLSHMNYIGKLESLDTDIQNIIETLSLSGTMKKSNQSKRKNYISYYNNEMIDRVSSVYKNDIDSFDYEFE